MRNNKQNYLLIILVTIMLFSAQGLNIYANGDDIFIRNGPRNKKVIALTFDDGPHPTETDEVLNVLEKYNVKATFFIAGKHANWYSKSLIRASEEGHEIGNHTFNHPDISNLSDKQIEDEIIKCEEILIKLTGKKPNLFRPPYGSYRKEELIEVAKRNNYKIVLWTTIDAKDWKNPPASSIANTVIDKAQNGDIILLHDYATDNTVEALDILIPVMISKGFEFVTVSQMTNN